MSIDVKKMSGADLKKAADSAKKATDQGSLKAIEKAKKDFVELGKDSKALSDAAKKNPDI